jgi:predicted nucleotidyltransferase
MAVNGIDESGPCGSRGSFRLEQPPFIERYIRNCAEHLAAAVGPEEIEGIFLCGSFALGEGGISYDTSPPLLVSDIDILVVLRRYEMLERLLPERYELGRSCEALTGEMQFSGRVDVGLMLPVDLERMPPRPGVFDLKRRGLTIYGKGEVRDLVPDYAPERVGGEEAVTLLENRIVSLLGRFSDPTAREGDFPYTFLYEIARVYTDIATALLCISGLYEPGYENRSRLFGEAVAEGRISVPVPEELVPLVSRWTGYKLRPSREFLERETDPDCLSELWDEASRRIVSCWFLCESFLQGRDPDTVSVARLLASRQSAEGMRTNLRAWRYFLAGMPIRSRLASLLGASTILLRRDPSSLIRATALRLMNRRLEGETGVGTKEIPGFPGHSWRTWEEAADEVSALWREMVYGRRDA